MPQTLPQEIKERPLITVRTVTRKIAEQIPRKNLSDAERQRIKDADCLGYIETTNDVLYSNEGHLFKVWGTDFIILKGSGNAETEAQRVALKALPQLFLA